MESYPIEKRFLLELSKMDKQDFRAETFAILQRMTLRLHRNNMTLDFCVGSNRKVMG